ncbi:MAG: flexitail domain-containing putative surface protein [Dehalococcoidia bacterium]
MALTIKGGDCDNPDQPTKCSVPVGGSFFLSVDVLTAPAQGYILVQTFIDYGLNLTYKETPDAAGEIVWPDAAIALRDSPGPGLISHGGLTGLLPPLPVSTFEGNVVELLMNCSPGVSSTEVKLLPEGDPVAGTVGSAFKDPDNNLIVPNLGSLTINCTDVPVFADTDGDGCTDLQELGLDEESGGQRDPNNPWDFYDTNGDGLVDLPNDILGVIVAFGAYDVTYDRGPSAGPDPWNMTAPDGVIDLPNDVLGVIMQFGHSCR